MSEDTIGTYSRSMTKHSTPSSSSATMLADLTSSLQAEKKETDCSDCYFYRHFEVHLWRSGECLLSEVKVHLAK